jgi:hypothetical protein
MEREQHSPDENEPRQPLREDGHEAGEDPRAPTISVEIGHLSLIPPEGGSWAEWVITRGIEEAEREDHPVDHRVAHYIAAFLGGTANPALRNLATTGAIDGPGIQEELVGHFFRQTEQVRSWIDRLAEYCMHREDRGSVENWRPDIDRQDQAEAQRVRRERLLVYVNSLYGADPDEQLAGVEDLGWFGLLHQDASGGWILHHQARDDSRDVFMTDSDAELVERWQEIAENYMRRYREERTYLPPRVTHRAPDDAESPSGAGSGSPEP